MPLQPREAGMLIGDDFTLPSDQGVFLFENLLQVSLALIQLVLQAFPASR
jgi:hypothetical protein